VTNCPSCYSNAIYDYMTDEWVCVGCGFRWAKEEEYDNEYNGQGVG